MTVVRCGLLEVAFCKTNPLCIQPEPEPEPEPELDKSIKTVDVIVTAYIIVAMPALWYSAPRFVEWVTEFILKII